MEVERGDQRSGDEERVAGGDEQLALRDKDAPTPGPDGCDRSLLGHHRG
jgi:hypothetical protein